MFLNQIVAAKQIEVEALKQNFKIDEAERQIENLPVCRGFEAVLKQNTNRSMGLIAEVKKASPSKGIIRADFDPVDIAKSYVKAGADCISVLTDRDYFQGSNEFLTAIRSQVEVPILRKDFIVDHRQIYEARLIGADAILLIAAILTVAQMRGFLRISKLLGMDTLVEVHDEEELKQVLELEVTLLGINNRNLKTFETNLKTTEQLIKLIPSGKTIVSESGISHPSEISHLRSMGAHAVLVGETFMRKSQVEQAVHDLMGPMMES